MEAIVLAGGKGTRLREILPDLPKPLAPVRGRPFLKYLLAHLEANGIRRVCLSTGYRAEMVRDAIGDRFGSIEVVYSHEEEPLGTGGAIVKALHMLSGCTFFALNGDTYSEIDLPAMMQQHLQRKSLLTDALVHVPDASRYGGADVNDGKIRSFHEKGMSGPAYINAGCYLLRRDAVDTAALPQSFSFEEKILTPLAIAGRVDAFLSEGFFLDIGIPSDYERATAELPIMASNSER